MGLVLELDDDAMEQIVERAAELAAEKLLDDRASREEGFMDLKAASRFLSCPPSRIYALVSARRIPYYKDGSRLLFRRSELETFVAEGGARRP